MSYRYVGDLYTVRAAPEFIVRSEW